MNGGTEERWSAVAAEWPELWGEFTVPLHDLLLDRCGVGPGTRVLDIGCGSGELLERAAVRGAVVAGVDPAAGMLAVAAGRVPGGDLRVGGFEALPWAAASFDLVVAVNALQFADDTLEAVAEAVRVTRPGGVVAIANWAEDARNDLDRIERAIAASVGDEVPPDGDLRQEGGLAGVLTEAGLLDIHDGLIELPWRLADDDALVRGALLGEDAATRAERAPIVLEAAAPFRVDGGGYLLTNAFRWATGQVPN